MTLFQRYILGELIRVFSLLLFVLTVLLVFVGLFQEASEQGLGAWQIIQIMPYVVPSMLPFTIPATLLLTVCVVYGRIAGDLEVVVCKAAGVNVMSLLLPAFILSVVLTVGSFFLTNSVIPWAVVNIETIVTQAMEDIFLDILRSNHRLSDARQGYSIAVTGVEGRTLIDPTFQFMTPDHEPIIVRARLAQMKFDLPNERVVIHLRDAVYDSPGSGAAGRTRNLEQSLPLPRNIRKTKARHLSLSAIDQRIRQLDEDQIRLKMQKQQEAAMILLTGDFYRFGKPSMLAYDSGVKSARNQQRRLTTEVHNRFAMSASCFFFVLLGGPFAVLKAKRQFLTSFFICFLPILLVYYPVMFLMINLCKTGSIEPWWSMWVPNAIIGIAGIIVLRKVIRH